MGTWKLEIAKMGMYITFPVALFYYFNQPKYFEEWVVKTKRELYPPENEKTREFKKAIEDLKQQQAKKILSGK